VLARDHLRQVVVLHVHHAGAAHLRLAVGGHPERRAADVELGGAAGAERRRRRDPERRRAAARRATAAAPPRRATAALGPRLLPRPIARPPLSLNRPHGAPLSGRRGRREAKSAARVIASRRWADGEPGTEDERRRTGSP